MSAIDRRDMKTVRSHHWTPFVRSNRFELTSKGMTISTEHNQQQITLHPTRHANVLGTSSTPSVSPF